MMESFKVMKWRKASSVNVARVVSGRLADELHDVEIFIWNEDFRMVSAAN